MPPVPNAEALTIGGRSYLRLTASIFEQPRPRARGRLQRLLLQLDDDAALRGIRWPSARYTPLASAATPVSLPSVVITACGCWVPSGKL